MPEHTSRVRSDDELDAEMMRLEREQARRDLPNGASHDFFIAWVALSWARGWYDCEAPTEYVFADRGIEPSSEGGAS